MQRDAEKGSYEIDVKRSSDRRAEIAGLGRAWASGFHHRNAFTFWEGRP